MEEDAFAFEVRRDAEAMTGPRHRSPFEIDWSPEEMENQGEEET
jgi:hypothetical protein